MKKSTTSTLKKTVALYDPYLDTLGGGEKHILSIIQVLEEVGYQPSIFWSQDLKNEIENKLNLRFQNLRFVPDIFPYYSFLKKFIHLRQYDLFFYVTDGSYFFSGAKKNYAFIMYPKAKLFDFSFFSRLKANQYSFITNSSYTQKWLEKWNVTSTVIYPYLSADFFTQTSAVKKEKFVLSIGRFYQHLHSKRQDLIIDAFRRLKEKHHQFADYKLILSGGLLNEDRRYFNKLLEKVGGDKTIILKPNLPFNELLALYRKSIYYWHFTGYGVDKNKNPELVEHLGITPLEAMATGNIVFCYEAGGPKELITDRLNGFLFKNENELFEKMITAENNPLLQDKMRQSAKKYAKNNFSYPIFKKRVEEVILNLKF